MAETITSPAQQAAVRAYRAMARRLQDEARHDDAQGRPLNGRAKRRRAAIAHRAAFAEIHNPEVPER